MAALTWRNVDSPSFASANQLFGLSAELMNRGFSSANRGIEQFRETTTDEQSAALMADVMAAGNDPAAIQTAIQAATQGRSTAFLSPEALRFANAQPGVLLDREAARGNIDLTGVRTDAARWGLGREQTLAGRDDQQFAARKQANPLVFQMQELARSGNLSGAQALAAKNADLLSRAGLNAETIYSGISSGFTGQMADTETGVQHTDFMRIAGNAQNARELIDRAGQSFGSEAEARRAIQDAQAQGVISADLAQTALGSLAEAGLWTAPSEADAAMRTLFPDLPTMTDRGSTASGWAAGLGNENPVFNSFMSTIERGGVTNPNALAAIAATGRHESGFSADNAGRSWDDPSESGRPGTAGGVMSWNNERLQNLQRFAAERGERGNGSPETQALFMLQEDPALIKALNQTSTPDEAIALMNNAWRFAGYDREGGEAAARRDTARQIAGGTPLTFGSNVPAVGSQPNASVYERLMAEAAGDPNRTPLTFGDGQRDGQDAPDGQDGQDRQDGTVGELVSDAIDIDGAAPSETSTETTPLVAGPTTDDPDAADRVSIMLQRVLSENPEGFTSDTEALDFLIENGTYPEGTTVSDVGSNGATSIADAANAQMERLMIQYGVAPPVDAEAVAREAAPNANYEYGQSGGLLSDVGQLAARTGEAVVNQAAGGLDVINAPFRMLSKYATGTDYIGATGRIDLDGDGYAQSLTSPITGTTRDMLPPEQRAALSGGDRASEAMTAAIGDGPAQAPAQQPGQATPQQPAQAPTRPERLTSTELASFLRTARNTGTADGANDLHVGLDRALVEGDTGETNLQELAAQLTGDDGALAPFDQQDVSTALNAISRELNVSLPVAAELLGGNAVYKGSDWNPLNWGSDLQYDMGEIRDRWRMYNRVDEEGRTGIEAAVARLNNRERATGANESVTQLETMYEQMVTQMNDQLAQASSEERRNEIRSYYEEQIFPRIYERVQTVGSSGALTMYSGNRTGQ